MRTNGSGGAAPPYTREALAVVGLTVAAAAALLLAHFFLGL